MYETQQKKMSKKSTKDSKKLTPISEVDEINGKGRKLRNMPDGKINSTAARVNKAYKKSNKSKKDSNDDILSKNDTRKVVTPEFSDHNNNATISMTRGMNPKLNADSVKRKLDLDGGKSAGTSSKKSRIIPSDKDLSEAGGSGLNKEEPNVIGLQSGGKLHLIQKLNDGIIVNVEADEFDFPDNVMADSDKESLQEEIELPKKTPPAKSLKRKAPEAAAGSGKPAGEEAIKRMFDMWMEERMAKFEQQALANDHVEPRKGKLIQGNATPGLNKNLIAAKRQSPIMKSPSDTTIYAPALKRATHKTAVENDLICDVSNFVDAIRLETDRSQPPGHAEAQKKAKQAMVEAEKFQAAIVTPPEGMLSQINVGNAMPANIVNSNDMFEIQQPQMLLDSLPVPVENNLQESTQKLLSDDDFFHLTCHIDPSLRSKIEKGEYVDLERLLPKQKGSYSNDTKLEWVQRDGGMFLVPASAERESKIGGIRRWDQAFRVYATIYCGANPSRSREIWQYVSVINTAASAYEWSNVANYDYTFRHLMEFNPNRSWASTYNQMWNLSMRDPLPKNSSGFKQTSYSNSQQQYFKSGSNGFSRSGSSSNKKKSRHSYCLFFNRGEKCKYGDRCRFIERCSQCDEADHHVLICPKLSKSKK